MTKALIETASRAGEAQQRALIKALRADVRRLEKGIVTANARAEIVAGLKAGARAPRAVRYVPNLHKRQATALIAMSDCHVGERVCADKVNGINAYDQHEAARRWRRATEASQWLITHHRNGFELREAVLWLGGDLITNTLHLDQLQSNTISTPEEVLLVQELASEQIDALASMLDRVRVICNFGNHGRSTAKPTISTAAENSWEWLLYQQLARAYAGHPKVEFFVSAGEFAYLDVYATRVRFTHGNAVNYGGGVGGIMIPINKALAKWETYQHADLTVMGHFHDYHSLPYLMVNGSLIGVSPFGMRVGRHQDPIQAFCLIDQKRGPCQHTPMWVTDRRKGK